MQNRKQLKAAAVTIGCRLNQAETSIIFDRLRQEGYEIVKPANSAEIDLIVVNSCTVTAVASQKSRQAVRKIRKNHPESCIVITGCSTETEAEYWQKEPAVDVVVPNSEKSKIMEYLKAFFADSSLPVQPGESEPVFYEKAMAYTPFRSRAFIKIQEGCNVFCSYCIVPYARGRERSRDWDEVIAEAQKHIDDGYKEIVLTGVNICAYEHNGRCLADLVDVISNIPGEFRIRLSSTEPNPKNHDLLKVIADNPKICRFLHLPLQNGNDEILKRMNRPYTTADFADFAYKAFAAIPGLHLGTDVIVGFPGETTEQFEVCSEFIKNIPFGNLHIFTYSKREGTPAASYSDQIPADVAKERYNKLFEIEKRLAANFAKSQIGQELVILVEKKVDESCFEGWSDNYLRVQIKNNDIQLNQLVKVKIESYDSVAHKLIGQVHSTLLS